MTNNTAKPEKLSIMTIGIIIMILAISLSPRIPLSIVIPGRVFDLRVEDIILVILLLWWTFMLMRRPKIDVTPLAKPLSIYIGIVFLTSCIAILRGVPSPLRTFFYFLKEIEYFVIFLLVANWIRTEKEIEITTKVILLAGLANGIWVGYQMVTHTNQPLFTLPTPEGIYRSLHFMESYGPALIGEISPLSVGGFFAFVLLLSSGYLLHSSKGYLKNFIYLSLSPIFFFCLFISNSRAAMIIAFIGLSVLFTRLRRKKLWIVPFLIFFIVIGIIVGSQFLATYDVVYVERVFLPKRYLMGIMDRVLNIWRPLFSYVLKNPLIGFGKGNTYFISNLQFEEAHNHYLLVWLETGFFGLLAFCYLLIRIFMFTKYMYMKSRLTISKIIAGATLGVTAGLIVTAFFQDVFKPVILNELWWIFLGLTAAAYRLERQQQIEQKTKTLS